MLAAWRPSPSHCHYTHPNIHQGRRVGFSVGTRDCWAPGTQQTSGKQFILGLEKWGQGCVRAKQEGNRHNEKQSECFLWRGGLGCGSWGCTGDQQPLTETPPQRTTAAQHRQGLCPPGGGGQGHASSVKETLQGHQGLGTGCGVVMVSVSCTVGSSTLHCQDALSH